MIISTTLEAMAKSLSIFDCGVLKFAMSCVEGEVISIKSVLSPGRMFSQDTTALVCLDEINGVYFLHSTTLFFPSNMLNTSVLRISIKALSIPKLAQSIPYLALCDRNSALRNPN